VKTLLARKQPPKGWQYFTVHAITHHSETASGYDGKVAAEMVGAKVEESNDLGVEPASHHVAKSTARPEFSLIALVCAGYEKTIAKDSWRSPSQTHRDYLNQLVLWGYKASTVEQLILDSGKPPRKKTKRHKTSLPGGTPPPGKVPADHHGRAGNLPNVGRSAASANHGSHSPAADRHFARPEHVLTRCRAYQGMELSRPAGSIYCGRKKLRGDCLTNAPSTGELEWIKDFLLPKDKKGPECSGPFLCPAAFHVSERCRLGWPSVRGPRWSLFAEGCAGFLVASLFRSGGPFCCPPALYG
jgi:hypothetical protein